MRLKSALRRGVAAAVIAGIVVSSGIPAYAAQWDIADGNITVKAGDAEGTNRVTQGEKDVEDTDTVITGKSDENTVTIDTSEGNVDVTFDDLKIDASDKGEAAVRVEGNGDVTIELDGDNELKSGGYNAGLEKDGHRSEGTLTIKDDKGKDGSLTAEGGDNGGAGIGGGMESTGSNIKITGGTIEAVGGEGAAGIGGGVYGSGRDIEISGGKVSATGGSYSGEYLRGDGSSIELDISAFTDPTTKNAADLVTYAIHAWESGWGYVWGTYGSVLTDSLFAYKLEQYPDGVGSYADFIRANWLGGRTTDCVGLIKGYGWLNPDTMTIEYGTNGMPDLGANQMYYNASVSGTIDTMPDIPGLAVWHDGHIGVYIGDGYVIEAMNTKKGVVKTKLEGRGWTHWLQIEYINYD